jgi:hypothetical protein
MDRGYIRGPPIRYESPGTKSSYDHATFFSGGLTASVIAFVYALPGVFVCSLNAIQFRLPEFHLNSSEILEVVCFAQPVRKLETSRKVLLSANLRFPIQVCDPRNA